MAQSNEPTIEKMNEAIALFMEWKWRSDDWYSNRGTLSVDLPNTLYKVSHMRFHQSLGWLMPVVERIESMGHKTIIGGGDHWGNYCNIMYNAATPEGDTKALGQGKTKTEAVYSAVCQFITWLNQQKQKDGEGEA